MNIPGLKDVLVTKVEEVGEKIQIHVEMERKFHRCPSCGNRTKQVHDYRIQRIQHLKWFERKTELLILCQENRHRFFYRAFAWWPS